MKQKEHPELKIKKEIEYWSKHLELDKFNYEYSGFFHLTLGTWILSLWLGLTAIAVSLRSLSTLIIAFVILIIFLPIIITLYLKKNKQNDLSFTVRERMIRQRYERLYEISKDKLNAEFEDIKKIYQNPTGTSVDLVIRDYYKNKL